MNQFDRDKSELGWLVAVALWIENRRNQPGFISGPVYAADKAQQLKPM